MRTNIFSARGLAALGFALAIGLLPVRAADGLSRAERERQLISVLQSDAAPSEKAITCKRLAIYGSRDAVPALAPLLANPDLASWARIALEAIPDPAANDALVAAAKTLNGRLLVGVLNSLGVRKDPRSSEVLAQHLDASDIEVAAAAAEALGHIGGPAATRALTAKLTSDSAALRSAAAYGAVICAERLLREGQAAEAAGVYDQVRQANVPRQRRLEATRGAILARQGDGLPLLIEQLKSTDKELFHAGLGTSREMPDPRVSQALVTEMKNSTGDRQVLLLIALADRRDPATEPAVLEVARTGAKPARLAAINVLSQVGNVSSVPALLEAAGDADPELARAAKNALVRMENPAVDKDLLARLGLAQGAARLVLAELTGQRRLEGAVPTLSQWLDDPDLGLRLAALQALGQLGNDQTVARLAAKLPVTPAGPERQQMIRSLTAICGRVGAKGAPSLLPLMKAPDAAVKLDALHLLAAVGGREALAAVVAAIDDPDESVQDEAVSTLALWPGNWPDDSSVVAPLFKLASSGKKLSHQVQGIRGFLDYAQEANLTAQEKVAKVRQILPLLKRPEEKRLAVATLGAVPSAAALELLAELTADPAVCEEACLAIVNLNTGRKLLDTPKEARQAALQVAVEKATSEGTKRKAEEALKRVNQL
ncbi:MAG: HEAT repeat domain-containing protein [Verrucomicrobia bacterium]|nr:HEAT repeat domain-containing protein [Verrucomicrobiota bacterium]